MMVLNEYGYGSGYGYGDGRGYGDGGGYGYGDGSGDGRIGARWRIFAAINTEHADAVLTLLAAAGMLPKELNTTLPTGI